MTANQLYFGIELSNCFPQLTNISFINLVDDSRIMEIYILRQVFHVDMVNLFLLEEYRHCGLYTLIL